MISDLERLVRLQQLDDFVSNGRRSLAELPERIQALDERLAEARQRLADVKQRVADNQTARRGHDKDLAAVQGRLSRFKDQIMEVKTNREYQAMQKEIETAQHEVRAVEDRILDRMLEAEDLTAALRQAEAALADEQQANEVERRAMEEAGVQLERQVGEAVAERADLVAGMRPDLVALFDQVARARRGIAVAEARDGHCAVCHVRLRPQRYNEIRRNEAVTQCDSCQRILYFAANAAPEEDTSA